MSEENPHTIDSHTKVDWIKNEKLHSILDQAHEKCLKECSQTSIVCVDACSLLNRNLIQKNPSTKNFQQIAKLLLSKGANPADNFLQKLKEASVLPHNTL